MWPIENWKYYLSRSVSNWMIWWPTKQILAAYEELSVSHNSSYTVCSLKPSPFVWIFYTNNAKTILCSSHFFASTLSLKKTDGASNLNYFYTILRDPKYETASKLYHWFKSYVHYAEFYSMVGFMSCIKLPIFTSQLI